MLDAKLAVQHHKVFSRFYTIKYSYTYGNGVFMTGLTLKLLASGLWSSVKFEPLDFSPGAHLMLEISYKMYPAPKLMM